MLLVAWLVGMIKIKFGLGFEIDGCYGINLPCNSVTSDDAYKALNCIFKLYHNADVYIEREQLEEIKKDKSLKDTELEWLYECNSIRQLIRIKQVA